MRAALISLFLLSLFPFALSGQESSDKTGDLNKTQTLGRRIYEQECGICHTQPTAYPMYGNLLYKDLVNGNEDAFRAYTQNGSKRMPGFKYTLAPAEIDAIVEYLKTVPNPSKKSQPKGEGVD